VADSLLTTFATALSTSVLSLLSLFKKINVGFWMPEPIFMKFGISLTPEPISTAYFINPSPSACLYVYPLTFARQRLGKKETAATNTHIKTEKLIDASFSMRSVSYQIKVGDRFFQELLIYSYLTILSVVRLQRAINGRGAVAACGLTGGNQVQEKNPPSATVPGTCT
jgi:hypothetical protein